MRNETLLKIIIGVFAIILIILGTFAYGNYVRSKQSSQNQANNQPTVNKPTETPAPAPAPAANNNNSQSNTPPPANNQPAKPVTTQPATPAQTPATGAAGNAALGATVIAVGIYIVRRTKPSSLAFSRSKR